MTAAPRHTFQVLTKRADRRRALLQRHQQDLADQGAEDAWPLPNVWEGVSVELSDYLDRVDDLRATPAAVRFLSLEPLLGPLPAIDLRGIHWVIVGGESGL